MYNSDLVYELKSYLLVVALFVACVLIITPVSILDNLQPIINYLFEELGETSFISTML